jgi:chloramphenicol-sensitive protein RarD
MVSAKAARARTRGYARALGAYSIWGLIPVYFKLVAAAPPLELLSHRVLWAFVLLLPVGWRRDRFAEVARALRSREARRGLAASTVLIALNWLVYIWAVFHGRIVEASLGYFLTPLVNVLLGVLVLKERLEREVALALAVAAGGVLWLTLLSGRPPWIAASLALSFGSYGLARKLVRNVGAVSGLTIETGLLTALALGYLGWAHARGSLAFLSRGAPLDALLVLAGPITAIPLLLFAAAVARLPLSSLGFLQYVSPSMQFLLAVLVYGEAFSAAQAGAFGLIWLALVLFAAHTLRRGAAEPVMEPE